MKPALSLLAFVPAAAYLALCLVFGGASGATPWPPVWFGYTGLVLVLLLSFPGFALRWSDAISGPFLVLLLFAALAALQLIPLPADLWSALAVRERLLQGFDLLGAAPPDRLPLTLSPEATFDSLLRLFPAMAILLLLVPVTRRSAILRLVWFIVIAGTAASVAGLLQLAAPELTLPDIHQLGPPRTASGLFANQNHQATLLLVCMPMAAALASLQATDRDEGDANTGRRFVLLAAILLLAAGVWATGSRAGLALLLPVIILCFPVWRGRRDPDHAGWTSLLVVLSTVMIGAVALLNSSRLPVPALADMTLSQDGREEIWQQSLDILRDNWMTGTGSGTFSSVYALYEDPNSVTGVYVNHAHNEYLQIAVETGLAGCLLMAVTLLVWGIASIRIWTKSDDGCRSLRRAASVSVLVILLHSLVDYPARTPALLVLGAALVFIQFFRPEPPPAANLPPGTRKKARGVVL